MDLGRYADARDDIERYLRPAFPEDGELSKWMGSCYQAAGKFREARDAYEDAVRQSPHDFDAYGLLVQLLRTHTGDVLRQKEKLGEALQKADGVMNAMVESNPKAFRAYLVRANYRRAYNVADGTVPALAAAAKDLARARNWPRMKWKSF